MQNVRLEVKVGFENIIRISCKFQTIKYKEVGDSDHIPELTFIGKHCLLNYILLM